MKYPQQVGDAHKSVLEILLWWNGCVASGIICFGTWQVEFHLQVICLLGEIG